MNMSSPSLAIVLHQASNHDELFMKQSLRFSETLRDLKSLRKQLYSAAEYFEASYGQDEDKELVIETLKDYAIKALVNTVDHLGSVSDKFNGFLDEKTNQMSGTDLRLSCLVQRMKLCREYIDKQGFYQQSLVIETPTHHKRYIFPDEDNTGHNKLEHRCRSFNAGETSLRFKSAIQATIRETPNRQGYSGKQHNQFASRTRKFSFTAISHDKTPDQRPVFPLQLPLIRSGSLLKRSISPSHLKKQRPCEPQRSISVSGNAERERRITRSEQYSSKSKRMFKALLSMRRTPKDSLLYKFLDKK